MSETPPSPGAGSPGTQRPSAVPTVQVEHNVIHANPHELAFIEIEMTR